MPETASAPETRVLVASRNPKKLRELRRVLDAAGVVGIEPVGLDEIPPYPETPETGATFEENALIKARDGAAASGMPCIADDSGIAVDALSGMPGVLSARWSGRHGADAANTALLLAQLTDVPDDRRGGAFVSACALVVPGPDGGEAEEIVVRGEWRGRIAREPRGDGGFGYDPVFVPDDDTRSAAELTPEEKDARSHRGAALTRLVPALRALAQR
ncbi:RdgB/HAM1 family non-canonical purine NTP pyrophosphatase [Rhodococcus rhodnii]|uniref:dITP/XTP pyrophosphatase n=2 Tax=Rhodococcus rhodnii TaxID=38312 RepID=R7WIZ1_9NOCA|nr:RdgB/HAM1 family non-canonical purine NTP pyrophosphatase [Rhodococcus rhodnii]EOM75178.1 putative deoxyribonucleotide triphosphate [Rhodococcus rhodnii LMG 5362]TXG91607.1 RdgB/HAM1 family non-canonical purine NTP pyrophosphatase [Rhodococcus rhodnii]